MKKIENKIADRILKNNNCKLIAVGESKIKDVIDSLDNMNKKEFEKNTSKDLKISKDIINKNSYTMKNKLGNFLLIVDADFFNYKKVDNRYINLYKVN